MARFTITIETQSNETTKKDELKEILIKVAEKINIWNYGFVQTSNGSEAGYNITEGNDT
jgi:hypothetical protein